MDSVKRKDFEGTLRYLTDLVKNNPEMEWPFMTDPGGALWINFPVDKRSLNKDLSNRDWYKGVSREWKPYISNVYKMIVGEQDLAVAVAVPLFDEKGKVIGILATAQSTAFFRKIVSEVGLNFDADISLMDQEGHIIYSSRFPYRKEVSGYPSFESIKKATKGEKGDVEIRDPSDGNRIKYVSFAPVEGIGWSIIVEKAKSKVLRSEYSYFILIAAISFLLYVVIALSLVNLREKQRKLAEFIKLNTELEERVRRRTSELEAANQELNKDITERKRAAEALRESENRYRNLIMHSPDAIMINLQERVILVNNECMRLFGARSADDLIGKSPYDLFHPGFHEQIRERIHRGRDLGEPVPLMEEKIIRLDGGIVDVEVLAAPFPSGATNAIHVILRDITERKRVEEALRDTETRYRLLFEHSPDGIVIIDPDTARPLEFNETAYRQLGYSREEFARLSISDFEAAETREETLARIAKVIQEGRNDFETRHRTRQGEIRDILVTAQIIEILGRSVYHCVWRDITERKRAEQETASLQDQLRQSQKVEAIGQLAGGISHDFNNLMTIIQGNAHLSLMDLQKGDPLRANIEEIRDAAKRAADLTRQLLAFSRKQILDMRVLDLNQVLHRLDKMLRRVIGEDIELTMFLPESIWKVKADPGQIEQVIMNLSVNARDAMPEGGKLTIETANVELDEEYARKHIAVQPGRYVMLSVSDTGVGMTPEVREKIFEPFFTTKERGKGTGLGLSTVYGIVKQSGGNIWVYSEPGQGTTFKIYLSQVDEPLEEQKEEAVGEVLQGHETILIVEDEDAVRKFAVRVLKKQGYKVLDAPDGGKAFTLCEEFKEPIHLILTDVVMPGMSGRKLADRLKAIHPEIKVLYMSGYTDNAILHHGILEPGINFIQKPFTVENLPRKVREVLDK
jgi:PAS domain S-box-containing protein